MEIAINQLIRQNNRQDEEIRQLKNQNQTLRQTRDILLPRLISGELSVENLKVKKWITNFRKARLN